MNNEPNVAPPTAARVWAAVRALDYEMDLQAGSLRRVDGRTRTLGLLVGSVNNPFASAIHRAVEDVALQRGVAVFASSLDDDPTERNEPSGHSCSAGWTDSSSHSAGGRPGYLGPVTQQGIPVVYVDREPIEPGIDTITSDNRAGAAAATEHLIAHGHRRDSATGRSSGHPNSIRTPAGLPRSVGTRGHTDDIGACGHRAP